MATQQESKLAQQAASALFSSNAARKRYLDGYKQCADAFNYVTNYNAPPPPLSGWNQSTPKTLEY